MSIDVATQTVFPLADTPAHVPRRRGGKKLNKATAFRWAKDGLRGVRLETLRVGGTLCTSVEALQRFFERLSEEEPRATQMRTPAARQNALARVDRELDSLGV